MVSSWHEEIACLLSLVGPYVAICGELVVASWEFVFGVLVYIELFILLSCFQMVAFEEHLDFEAEVILIGVGTNSEIIEPVLLVHGVLHVVEISLMGFKELVIFRVVCK